MEKLRLKTVMGFASGMALATPALAQQLPLRDEFYGHMLGGGYGMGYGMGFVGIGMMLLFWGVIIFLTVLAVRWFAGRGGNSSGGASALEILKERLARGEIDPDDYETRRKVLEV
ncbi:MAG: SHOCT domain-containing protein [Paracoccaceae bacterium]